MQVGSVDVTVQVLLLIHKMAEGVGAVDDHLDPPLSGHLADILDRKNLTGKVGDMADEDHLCPRRDVFFEKVGQHAQV